MNKKDLEQILHYHDDLYYNRDNPEISDAEYDSLKNQYVKLYGEYNYVPGEAVEGYRKYTHTTPILSLDKCQINNEEELRAHIERLWPVIIEDKFDGLTAVTYEDEDVSRGNGITGEVITNSLKKVSGIGKKLKNPVRSEIVLLKSEFDKINAERIRNGEKPFDNTRNAAAGMIRRLDNSDIKGLKAFAYNILYDNENNNNSEQLSELSKNGWNVANYYKPKDVDDAYNYIINYDKDSLDYDIDGLVIKHDGDNTFGLTGHHPKCAVAVKFVQEGKWATLYDIVPQVGRTGKIVPVAKFEPVDIDGSNVKSATFHNYGIVEAQGLNYIHYDNHKNSICKVYVIKANGVIPKIIDVDNSFTKSAYSKKIYIPSSCPVCGGEVEKINLQYFCKNPSCSAKILGNVIRLAERDALNIEGLNIKTVEKMIDLYIKTIDEEIDRNEEMRMKSLLQCSDTPFDGNLDELIKAKNNIHQSIIFDFGIDDILKLEGYKEKSAKKLYNAIQKSRTCTLDKALYAASMPLIGNTASKLIAERYVSLENLLADTEFEKLKNIKDVGPKLIESFKENFQVMFMPLVNYLDIKPMQIVETKKPDIVLTFVVTGEFEISRNNIKAMIEGAGHKVTGSVSKKTDYLLIDDLNSTSTKAKQARELNIKMLNNLKELEEIIC